MFVLSCGQLRQVSNTVLKVLDIPSPFCLAPQTGCAAFCAAANKYIPEQTLGAPIQLAKCGVTAQTFNDYEGVCHTVFRHTTPHQMESIRIVQLIRINSTALAKSPERALLSGNIIYRSAPTPRETSSVHTYRLQREGVLLRSYTIVTR